MTSIFKLLSTTNSTQIKEWAKMLTTGRYTHKFSSITCCLQRSQCCYGDVLTSNVGKHVLDLGLLVRQRKVLLRWQDDTSSSYSMHVSCWNLIKFPSRRVQNGVFVHVLQKCTIIVFFASICFLTDRKEHVFAECGQDDWINKCVTKQAYSQKQICNRRKCWPNFMFPFDCSSEKRVPIVHNRSKRPLEVLYYILSVYQ